MTAYLFIHRGQLAWSGHNACGDPSHKPYALVVDVGRDFILTSDETACLYLIGPGPQHFAEFTPEGFALAARGGYFGFRVVEAAESRAREGDRKRRAVPRDRRARIARELEGVLS